MVDPRIAASPLVSIVIPAYNVAAFIADALSSAFAQTCTDYEVIVVNDGSPDTEALEQAIAPFRDRIEYVSRENGGPSAARNTGIRLARGEYVAFLDADDTLLPIFLEEHISRARLDPGADVFYGDLLIFGDVPEAGRTVMEFSPSNGAVNFESLVDQQCNPAMCSLVRRQTLLAHGLFDETFRRSEDFDLWLRLAYSGVRFNYTRKVVARHGIRPGGLSADTVRMYQSMRLVLEKCARTMNLNDSDRALLVAKERQIGALERLHEGKRALLGADYSAARVALGEANAVLKSRKLSLVLAMLRFAPGLLRFVNELRDRTRQRGAHERF